MTPVWLTTEHFNFAAEAQRFKKSTKLGARRNFEIGNLGVINLFRVTNKV